MTQVNRNIFFKTKNVAREVGFRFIGMIKDTKTFDEKSLSKISKINCIYI